MVKKKEKEEEMDAGFLDPEGHVEGGGLLDDVDVKWIDLEFKMWDYNGTVDPPVPALCITMEVDGEEEEAEQYFSAGNPDHWTVSDDGTTLEPAHEGIRLNKSTNLSILLSSLVENGFPTDRMKNDCTVFEGLECHMIRVPAPKRPGIAKRERDDGRDFAPTNLVVDSISSLPGEKKAKKGKSGGKKDKGKSGTSDPDVTSKASEAVMKVLTEMDDDSIPAKKMVGLVFKALADDPDRNAVSKLLYKDDFLNDGPWEYDDGDLSLS